MSVALALAGASLALGGLSAAQSKNAAKIQAAAYKAQGVQYNLQAEQMEVQRMLLRERYRTQRQLLTGDAVTRAAASGVKISGSVADSISQSLAELNKEEIWQNYNINVSQAEARYNARMAFAGIGTAKSAGNINATNSLLNGVIGAVGNYFAFSGSGKTSIIGRGDE